MPDVALASTYLVKSPLLSCVNVFSDEFTVSLTLDMDTFQPFSSEVELQLNRLDLSTAERVLDVG